MGNYEDDFAAQISEFSESANERLLRDGQGVLDLLTAGGEQFDLSSFTRRVAELRALICDELCENVPHAKLDVDDASKDARYAHRARRQRERELNFWDKVWRAHNGCAEAFAGSLIVYPDAPVEFRITPKDRWDLASEKRNPTLLLPWAKLEARQRIDAALEPTVDYLLRLAKKRSNMGSLVAVEPVAYVVQESTSPPAQPDQLAPVPKRRGRPPIPIEAKHRALDLLKAGKPNLEVARALYNVKNPDPRQRRSVATILRRIDPGFFEQRKLADREKS